MSLELVSFALCPYVQRSVITLKYKKAPFKITFIDLENPPEWFNKISPMGKVPVLKVNEDVALFESAVINEYVDETIGEPLHSKDPLQKAFERAWIEYGSELMMYHYHFTVEKDPGEAERKIGEFFAELGRLENILKEGPYFRGKAFSLVDTSYAPLFMRLMLSDKIKKDAHWTKMPKVRGWAEALLAMPAVKDSVGPTFAEDYKNYCRQGGSTVF